MVFIIPADRNQQVLLVFLKVSYLRIFCVIIQLTVNVAQYFRGG
jgi:hypothetical protein